MCPRWFSPSRSVPRTQRHAHSTRNRGAVKEEGEQARSVLPTVHIKWQLATRARAKRASCRSRRAKSNLGTHGAISNRQKDRRPVLVDKLMPVARAEACHTVPACAPSSHNLPRRTTGLLNRGHTRASAKKKLLRPGRTSTRGRAMATAQALTAGPWHSEAPSDSPGCVE